MSDELTWYVARASGLTAWALLAVAVLWGLLLSTRLLERRPSPAWLLDLHRHLGWLALVFSGVHLTALFLDDFVRFTPAELLVPFLSDYDTTAVALGVVAFHLLVAVQVSSWLRDRLSAGVWRSIHWLSAPLFVVVSAHGLLAGTDVPNPVVTGVGLVLAAEVLLVFVLRVGGGRPHVISGRDDLTSLVGPDATRSAAAPGPPPHPPHLVVSDRHQGEGRGGHDHSDHLAATQAFTEHHPRQ
ncbi:MAG: ferric reductase-like transmembrane domain-containing protein [Acidimicrobiales bacterium]